MINLDACWRHLTSMRWFAGKGRGGRLVALTPLDWYVAPSADGPGIRSEIATVVYPPLTDGAPEQREFYHLLISYRPDVLSAGHIGDTSDGHAHIATFDLPALQTFVNAMRRPSNDEDTNWWSTIVNGQALSGDLTPRVLAAEQSNTSIVLGDRVMMKLFRRIEAGNSLDIVLLDALSRNRVRQVAQLYGWLNARAPLSGTEPERVHLAMLSEYVPGSVDGWVHVRDAASAGRGVTDELHALGRALARVHHGLAEASPAARVRGDELADLMHRRLDQASLEIAEIAAMKPALSAIFDQLRGQLWRVQTVHGDFHLGQALLAPSGWRILDFEGEPMKPLAERGRPDSVWRDVAGLARSIGYASAQATFDDDWVTRHTNAFISGYSGATIDATQAAKLAPEDQLLLDAYVADKAIYEAIYESRNRPGWVDIPMSALRRITARAGG